MKTTLSDPLLADVPHGFGTRAAEPLPGVLRPKQVHGCAVVNGQIGEDEGDTQPPQSAQQWALLFAAD